MRVIFMGTPAFSVPALDALVNAGHEVAAVYSQPPRPAGRGKKDRPTAVHARADELGLSVHCPASFANQDAVEEFRSIDADIAVVVAYGLILPKVILEAPIHGCLNIHASILPRWRGAAPIHRAIMAGDRETGVCIMQMDEGLDTGDIRKSATIPIGDEETTADLHDRLSRLGADSVTEVLKNLDGFPPIPQRDDGVIYAHKIDKAEAKINWSEPAQVVDRKIRGLSPFPGAWTTADGERLKLLRSRLSEGAGPAGQVLGAFKVACGEGAFEVLEAQRQGKRPVASRDLLLGYSLPSLLK